MIAAIARGRCYMARETRVEIDLACYNADTPAAKAGLGDTLLRSGNVLVRFSSNTPGTLRLIDQQGCFSETTLTQGAATLSVPGRSLWLRAELRDADGSMIALTNPVFFRHPLTAHGLLPE